MAARDGSDEQDARTDQQQIDDEVHESETRRQAAAPDAPPAEPIDRHVPDTVPHAGQDTGGRDARAGQDTGEQEAARGRRADEREKRLDLREQRLDDRQTGLTADRDRLRAQQSWEDTRDELADAREIDLEIRRSALDQRQIAIERERLSTRPDEPEPEPEPERDHRGEPGEP